MNLKDLVTQNKQLDLEADNLVSQANQLQTTKKYPTEEELQNYLLEHKFERVTKNFHEMNFSSISKYLEKNQVYCRPDGYLLEINKQCCGCRLAEDDGINYYLSKIRKPNKQNIKRAIKSFDRKTQTNKLERRSFLLGPLVGLTYYFIGQQLGVNFKPEDFSALGPVLVGALTTASSMIGHIVKYEVLDASLKETLGNGKQNSLEKLVEVCEEKE